MKLVEFPCFGDVGSTRPSEEGSVKQCVKPEVGIEKEQKASQPRVESRSEQATGQGPGRSGDPERGLGKL